MRAVVNGKDIEGGVGGSALGSSTQGVVLWCIKVLDAEKGSASVTNPAAEQQQEEEVTASLALCMITEEEVAGQALDQKASSPRLTQWVCPDSLCAPFPHYQVTAAAMLSCGTWAAAAAGGGSSR